MVNKAVKVETKFQSKWNFHNSQIFRKFREVKNLKNFSGKNCREWPEHYDFAGINFREPSWNSRNRESLYPRNFLPLRYFRVKYYCVSLIKESNKYTLIRPFGYCFVNLNLLSLFCSELKKSDLISFSGKKIKEDWKHSMGLIF